MKYTPLSSLQNPYPSISKYRTNENGGIVLNGVYPQNKLDFQTPDIDEFTVIPNSKFKFVVAISNNNVNNTILDLLISDEMYSLLERAKNEPNPYFLNTVLNPNTWVYIYVDPLFKTFQTQREEEKKYAVEIDYNVIFDKEGTPDFTRIGKFLDWVITPPKLEDVENDGVIPLEDLEVQFSLGGYDHESQQWVTKEQATFLRKLDDLEDELASVRSSIQEIDEFLANPKSLKQGGYLTGLIGPSAAALVVSVTTVTPAAAVAITQAAASAAARALASTVFGGTVTTTAAVGKIATSFLGGPVGLGIAIAGIIFSIFQSKKKKRENEERVRRFSQYVETITSDRLRLAQREQKLISDLEKLNNSGVIETTTNGSSTTTNQGTTTTTTTSGGNSQVGSGETRIIVDPIDEFDTNTPPFVKGNYTGETYVKPNGTKWVWLPAQGGWTKAGRSDRER